ncbi:Transglutaminase-like enzyme, putative cysteine protease [Sphingomonas gellani]|uniref:Transglutaminase-like enzyme, putative cysteine protease n=1 Tax=Sphingomonas gellani TaxID=1166340 RepID=A0A1H8DCI0_9SPHN|nr:transglutaminase family protein [Sphingomonas gellani]SEN04982.1 Transglutaminase-like enzyme, putative cysteine protease [Sphingomonas gellani]
MRLKIRHRTTYRFDQPQVRLVQLARLTPGSFAGQTVIGWEIDVDCDARLRPTRDGYGNEITMIYVDGPLEALTIEVAGDVLTEDRAGVVRGAAEPLQSAVFLRSSPLTKADAAIVALADDAHHAADNPLGRLHALNGMLADRMRFDAGGMDVRRTGAEALSMGHGVCQDFTHVFVAAAREMGIPARYVSGHLFRRDGADEQPAAHAWAEACVEDLGWVGFDSANGISPDDAYVRVAVGLDYREAAPIAGARTGMGEETLDVAVSVTQSGYQRQS